MAKATGLISLLFDIVSSSDMLFANSSSYSAWIMEVLLFFCSFLSATTAMICGMHIMGLVTALLAEVLDKLFFAQNVI